MAGRRGHLRFASAAFECNPASASCGALSLCRAGCVVYCWRAVACCWTMASAGARLNRDNGEGDLCIYDVHLKTDKTKSHRHCGRATTTSGMETSPPSLPRDGCRSERSSLCRCLCEISSSFTSRWSAPTPEMLAANGSRALLAKLQTWFTQQKTQLAEETLLRKDPIRNSS